jgi:two-component system LytT family response regulator
VIKVIIIDDEPLAQQLIASYLAPFSQFEIIAFCNNGFEAIKALQTHKPDLLFMDIQMPKLNGFEVLELMDKPIPVIFCTAFDDYAIQAFENNAIDYLLKPINKARFEKAIQKFLENYSLKINTNHIPDLSNEIKLNSESKNRIVLKTNGEIKILNTHLISHIEAFDDYVKIYYEESTYLKKKTLNYYEQVLDQSLFIRVHRSFLLNISYLNKIEPYEKNSFIGMLNNGYKINVSKAGYSKITDLMNG